MGDKTKIEWTEATWNPTTGCTRVSEGCRNCYIERTPPFRTKGRRFEFAGAPSHEVGASTGVDLHPDRLDAPLRWVKPRRVFVNSMSDLFHADVPHEFIAQVFAVMAEARVHAFQVLTKRPGRMCALLSDDKFRRSVEDSVVEIQGFRIGGEARPWPLPNVWLGVSVEDQETADKRIPELLATPAAVHFISAEPLLGPLDLAKWLGGPCLCIQEKPLYAGIGSPDHDGSPIRCEWCDETGELPSVDWLIVGGESGPHARPMHPDWARSLRDHCQAAGVPFFFKQWGEWAPRDQMPAETAVAVDAAVNLAGHPVSRFRVGKKAAGRLLDGRTWDEYPQPLTTVTS